MANEQRNYKDIIFRMIFKDKGNLLSLCNAVNRTEYRNNEGLRAVSEKE